HEQFGPDFTEEPPPPEVIEDDAWNQVHNIVNSFVSGREVTPVLWFWDEASTSLVSVRGEPIPIEFDVTLSERPDELSDPPQAPTVSASPRDSTGEIQVSVQAGPGRSLVGVDLELQRGAGNVASNARNA